MWFKKNKSYIKEMDVYNTLFKMSCELGRLYRKTDVWYNKHFPGIQRRRKYYSGF